ncbi:MAG: SDR family oxidoreductase [Arenicella sp.]|nr:SDR family oxidoreductase [Arenicella sp.]
MSEKQAVVVTGGSVGIGLSICQHLLSEGYVVVNLARRAATIEHSNLHNVVIDLSDRSALELCAKRVASNFQVSGFVHNAGLIRPSLLEDVSLDDLGNLNQVHLGAAITLTQAFLPSLKQVEHGRIVLISSRAAMGLATRTSYSATKSGMLGMARTWALELAHQGITVNCVAPGPIEATEMFDAVVEDGSDKKAALAASIPVKRIGRPEDVARAVGFFIDPNSSFITGQTLMVCGGSSLGGLSI